MSILFPSAVLIQSDGPWHIASNRVLELEAQLEVYVADVHTVPGVQMVLDLLHITDMKEHYTTQLQHVAQKCLDVINKYKKTQLPFYDEVRGLDPRQRDSMQKDIK